MAIQDVIILPDYECGTSLRIYNPNTHTWDVAYGYAVKISSEFLNQAQKEGISLVLKEVH